MHLSILSSDEYHLCAALSCRACCVSFQVEPVCRANIAHNNSSSVPFGSHKQRPAFFFGSSMPYQQGSVFFSFYPTVQYTERKPHAESAALGYRYVFRSDACSIILDFNGNVFVLELSLLHRCTINTYLSALSVITKYLFGVRFALRRYTWQPQSATGTRVTSTCRVAPVFR